MDAGIYPKTKTTKKKTINLRKTVIKGVLLTMTSIIFRLETVPILQFISQSASAQGTVVNNVDMGSSGHSEHSYSPMVAFSTRTGQNIKFKSSSSQSLAEFHIGDPATVLYDPKYPHHAEVISFFWIDVVCIIALLKGIHYISYLRPKVRAAIARDENEIIE